MSKISTHTPDDPTVFSNPKKYKWLMRGLLIFWITGNVAIVIFTIWLMRNKPTVKNEQFKNSVIHDTIVIRDTVRIEIGTPTYICQGICDGFGEN